MAEPRIYNTMGAALSPYHIRSMRDWVGFRAWLHPAQVTSYAELNDESRRILLEHTLGGIPCFVDPNFPKDQIDFIAPTGEVLSRLTNLAIPIGYNG